MRPSRSSTFGRADGFTLMEIIVATAVAAVVLLAINGAFFGALRMSNTTRNHLSADHEVQRTLSLVRKDIEGLMLPGGVLSGQLQTNAASGLTQGSFGDQVGPDLYTNTGSIDGWNPFSELQRVGYYLMPGEKEGSRNLVRVVTRNLLPAQIATQDSQVLLHDVSTAGLEFYDGTSWTDAWDSSSSSTLPTAMRFYVSQKGTGDKPQSDPVEIVVPILVETPASLAQAMSGGSGT